MYGLVDGRCKSPRAGEPAFARACIRADVTFSYGCCIAHDESAFGALRPGYCRPVAVAATREQLDVLRLYVCIEKKMRHVCCVCVH